jgi:tetratricopeptide (TPR) repeat protein
MADAQNSSQVWQKVAKTAVFLAVFLVPLIFLPWTVDVLNFNKQAIFILLVFLSLFCWLLKSLMEEKISIDVSGYNLSFIIYIAVLGLATLFSAYRYGSFWGWPLSASASFLSSLGFVLLCFLILNLFREKEDVFGILFSLIVSGLFVALFALPQVLGKFWLPFDWARNSSFNTIGTVNALAVFLAALLPLAAVIGFIAVKRLVKILLVIFILASVFLLVAANFWAAWVTLLLGASLILVFGIARREILNFSWMFLPMILLAVSLFALLLNTSLLPLNLASEVSPTNAASVEIATETMKEYHSPWSLLFGSGPGTFAYDYSKFKPLEVNQSVFWATRFGSASSEMLDRLATTGVLGLLSFLAVLLVVGLVGFRALVSKEIKPKENYTWVLLLGAQASILALLGASFLYPLSFSASFLLWTLVASVLALVGGKVKSFDFRAEALPETKEIKRGLARPGFLPSIGVSFAFIAVLILGLGVSFATAQRYFAEVNYVLAMDSLKNNDTISAINRLGTAIRLTGSKQDNYFRDLAQVYLFRINEELARKDIPQDQISTRVNDFIGAAVGAAKSAVDVSPKNVVNLTIRGYVYNNLVPFINGAEEWAAKAYEEAVNLEPGNPSILADWGRVYLAKADTLAQDKTKADEYQSWLNKAKEKYQEALDLKSDYAVARFQLAMVDVREGKTKDAISKLEDTKTIAPFDTGLAFQLGVIYYSDNQLDKARAEFERAVALDQNYSNARYFLGLVYDKQGEKQKAIEQLQRVAELNPDNEQMKKIIENLKAGKAALEGVVQEQPPVQEQSIERLASPSPSPSPSASPSPSPSK